MPGYIPPEISAAYRKVELRMANGEYSDFGQELKTIAGQLSRGQVEFMLAMLHHPLLRPGAMKILLTDAK